MPASTVRSGSGQLESTLSSRDAPVQSIDTLGELGVLSFPRLQKESHSHSNATATLQRQVLRPPGSSAEDWAADWAWWQILRPPFPPPLPALSRCFRLSIRPVAGTSRFAGARPRSVSLPALAAKNAKYQQLRPETYTKAPHHQHGARSVFGFATVLGATTVVM